jgi:glucose/arabinose dehydrogenase
VNRRSCRRDEVVDLPAGTRNHHWTKNLIASPDGSKLYVTVGSNSNAAENGIEVEEGRAAIWEVDAKTGSTASSPRPAQPERPRLGAEDRRAVDGRQ